MGPNSNFYRDFGTASALANFTNNAAAGSLTVRDGRIFTTAASFNNAGQPTIGPGSTLVASGDYIQASAGSLDLQLGGSPTSGQFGQLTTPGSVNLAGRLRVSLVNDYAPRAGDSFAVVSFGSHTGTFATTDGLTSLRVRLFEAALTASNLTFNSLVNASDLAAETVAIPPSGVPGQSVTIAYSVRNNVDLPTTTDTWFDWVYLSADDRLDRSDKLIGQAQHVGTVGALSSYGGTLTAPIPGVPPGDYRFIPVVDARGMVPDLDRTNNIAISTGAITLTIPELVLNTPLRGQFETSGQSHYYQITVPAGRTLVVSLDSDASSGSNELHIRRGAIPTTVQFDARSRRGAFQPDQELVVPATQAGIYYVLVQTQFGQASASPYTITAGLLGFAIRTTSPSLAGNAGYVTLALEGSEFSPLIQVSLVAQDATELPAIETYFADALRLYSTFDLRGRPVGLYDLRVTKLSREGTPTGESAELPGSLRVTEGLGARFESRLVGLRFVRAGRDFTLSVEYANNGDADMIPGLLVVRSSSALMKLAGSQSGFNNRLHLLAVPLQDPAGILPPGASGRIDLISTAPGGTVTYELSYIPANSPELFPWDPVEAIFRPAGVPDAEWIPFWAGITSRIGSTWGEVLTRLSETATQANLPGPDRFSFDDLLAWLITAEAGSDDAGHSHCPSWTFDPAKCAAAYDPATDVRLPGSENWNPDASRTFIITHGNGGPAERFGGLADEIHNRYPDANVIRVEWPKGSSHLDPWWSSFQINPAAAEAARRLQQLPGFDPNKVTMIGESFGNYVNAAEHRHFQWHSDRELCLNRL